MSDCKFCGNEDSSTHICNMMPIQLQNGFRAINHIYVDEPRRYRKRIRNDSVAALALAVLAIVLLYFGYNLLAVISSAAGVGFYVDALLQRKPPGCIRV